MHFHKSTIDLEGQRLISDGVLKDVKSDLAATILRILYIKDLRLLQTQIDDMIEQIQVRYMVQLAVCRCMSSSQASSCEFDLPCAGIHS